MIFDRVKLIYSDNYSKADLPDYLHLDLISTIIAAIAQHLISHNPTKEYTLIGTLQSSCAVYWSKDTSLALFQKHFLVQHSLYFLKKHLGIFNEAGCEAIDLDISALKIELLFSARQRIQTNQSLNQHSAFALSQFYLDWAHYKQATPETVSDLLASFWKKLAAFENQDEDYNQLGLTVNTPFEKVKTAYQILAAKHHPDKGGDSQRFSQITQAYQRIRGKHRT